MATNVTKKGKLKNIDVENNTETLMHPETSSDVVLLENVSNSTIPSDADNLTKLINKMGALAFKSSLSSSDVSGSTSGTVTSVATGVGLTGGTITGSGTIKAKLKSETALTNDATTSGNTANRTYAVAVDKSGNLAVNVPWTDTTYSAGTGISLSGTTFNNSGVRSIATGSTNGTIGVNTNGTNAEVAVKGLGSAAYTESTAYAPPVSVTQTITSGTEVGKIIVGNTTKTLYSPGVFTGATSERNGGEGLVPWPAILKRNWYLRGDGDWAPIMSEVEGGIFTPSLKINNKECIFNDWDDTNNNFLKYYWDSSAKEYVGTPNSNTTDVFQTKAKYWRVGTLLYLRMYLVFNPNNLPKDGTDHLYVYGDIKGLPFNIGTNAGRHYLLAYTSSGIVGAFNIQAAAFNGDNSDDDKSSRIRIFGSTLGYCSSSDDNINVPNLNYIYRKDGTSSNLADGITFVNDHPTIHISGVIPIASSALDSTTSSDYADAFGTSIFA